MKNFRKFREQIRFNRIGQPFRIQCWNFQFCSNYTVNAIVRNIRYLCTCCGWFNRCVCAASLYDVCIHIFFFSLGFRSSLGAIREIGFKFPANKHTCISCTRTRLDYKLDRKMVCLTPCIRLIFKTCVSSIIFFIRVYHYMNMSLTQLVFCFELYILLGFFL